VREVVGREPGAGPLPALLYPRSRREAVASAGLPEEIVEGGRRLVFGLRHLKSPQKNAIPVTIFWNFS
jgi:hypothetical protein